MRLEPFVGSIGGSLARSSGYTDQRNAASLFPGCPLPIDQRRLTSGVYGEAAGRRCQGALRTGELMIPAMIGDLQERVPPMGYRCGSDSIGWT